MPLATTALLRGLSEWQPDQIFEDKGLKDLLQISYVRITFEAIQKVITAHQKANEGSLKTAQERDASLAQEIGKLDFLNIRFQLRNY